MAPSSCHYCRYLPTPSHSASGGIYSATFPQSILPPYPALHPFLQYPSKPRAPTSAVCLSLSKPKTPLIPRCSATSPAQFLPNPQHSASKPPPPQPPFPPNPPGDSLSSSDNGPPTNDYLNLLRLSVRYGDCELAAAVHGSILKLEEHVQLSNALIAAYVKLGRLTLAHRVFSNLSCPDVVSYSTMISGFAKANREYEAVELFSEMRSSGIEPNEFTFVAILTACIRLSESELGFQFHSLAIKMGYFGYTFVSNALMGLYSKCGLLDFALALFDEMPQRDLASWNSVIAGLVKDLSCLF